MVHGPLHQHIPMPDSSFVVRLGVVVCGGGGVFVFVRAYVCMSNNDLFILFHGTAREGRPGILASPYCKRLHTVIHSLLWDYNYNAQRSPSFPCKQQRQPQRMDR